MRKPIALIILVCIFLPVMFSAMTLLSLRPWLLDRGFYERMVSDEHLYDTLFVERLPNQFHLGVFTDTNQLPVAALQAALRELVTPAYQREQALKLVDDAFDFIDGRTARFEAAFDLIPLKTALAGDTSGRFAAALAGALPSCEAGQAQIVPGGTLARCIPTDGSVTETEAQIATALPGVIEQIPDQVVLNKAATYGEWWSPNWLLGMSVRGLLDFGLVTLIIIAVVSGIIGSWLGGDDLRGRLKWFSSSLFFPASLFVLMGVSLVLPVTSSLLRSELSFDLWTDTLFGESSRQAIVDIAAPLVQQIGSGFLIVGVVTFVLACGLLLWSWTVKASAQHTHRIVQVPAQNS